MRLALLLVLALAARAAAQGLLGGCQAGAIYQDGQFIACMEQGVELPSSYFTCTSQVVGGIRCQHAGNITITATSVSVPFTNGDTTQRVTVTDGNVTSTSRIVGTVRKANTTEANDSGWYFDCNVVFEATGSFDLVCWGQPLGESPTSIGPGLTQLTLPNETITFVYNVM